jgi:putative endonuclease
MSEKNGSYYVGSTKDTDIRLIKHNKGQVSSTKSFRPWKIIYTEEFKSLSGARKRERQIKSWKND